MCETAGSNKDGRPSNNNNDDGGLYPVSAMPLQTAEKPSSTQRVDKTHVQQADYLPNDNVGSSPSASNIGTTITRHALALSTTQSSANIDNGSIEGLQVPALPANLEIHKEGKKTLLIDTTSMIRLGIP